VVRKQNNKKERLMHWQNMWTEEDNARLVELDKKGVRVRDIAIRMNKSKNSVAGRLHRIRIKQGHTPKYKHRQVKRYMPASEKIGQRTCNLCYQKFDISSVLQRFCEPCKRTDNYRFG
jgi:IS30 family transposase